MKISPLLSSLVVALAIPTAAHAAPQWVDGPSKTAIGQCAVTAKTESFVGYVDDPISPLKTGDVTYVHVVVRNDSCWDGVSIQLFLPLGAKLAIDSTHQVFCLRESVPKPGMQTLSYPIANCQQTPIIGANNGFNFIYDVTPQGPVPAATALVPDRYVELQVPVVFERELVGTDVQSVGAVVHSLWTPMYPMIPMKPVTVAYAPKLAPPSISTNATTSATATFTLTNFYEAGDAAVEYSTNHLGWSSTVGAYVPGTHSFSGTQHPQVLPYTTYYARVRFWRASTNTYYYSAEQQFTTGPISVTLSLSLSGTGMGRVISSVGGIDCGGGYTQCTATVPHGTTITLTPLATLPNMLTEWGGMCFGAAGLCRVTIVGDSTASARFDYVRPTPLPGPLPPPTPRR